MKTIRVTHRAHRFTHPATEAPVWSAQIDRWHQLDAAAFGLADAAAAWRPLLTNRPHLIILASPGGSNLTDRRFAQTQGTSPSLFVHTLPSSRASSLCQMIDWHGPVICIQADPITCLTALREACDLAGDAYESIWLLSLLSEDPLDHRYAAHLFIVGRKEDEGAFEIEWGSEHLHDGDRRLLCDEQLFSWLADTQSTPALLPFPGSYVMRRRL